MPLGQGGESVSPHIGGAVTNSYGLREVFHKFGENLPLSGSPDRSGVFHEFAKNLASQIC